MQQYAAIIWTTDNQLCLTSLQGADLTRLDLRPAELIGRSLHEWLSGEVAPIIDFSRKVLAGEAARFLQPWQGRLYEIHIDALHNGAGQLIGTVAVVLDTQRQKALEETLRLSEERYQLLAANLPQSVILLFDHDLRFVLVDGPEVERHGYSKATMEGRTPHEALPAAFAQLVEPNMRAILAGERFTAELPYGDEFYHYTCLPLQNSAGVTLYGMILGRNVTERRRNEAALRENEAKYHELFELGLEAIFLIDNESSRILEANSAATEMYGYSHEELLQLCNLDLSAEPEQTRQATTALPPGSVNLILLRYHRRKDGTVFPVEICARFFVWQGRPVHVAAIRDISERKQNEQQREALIGELEQKNEELERFTYTVSHDLRSPLITISSFLNFLEQDARAGNQERVSADIGRIREATVKMERLLKDLLELSRIGRLMNPSQVVPFNEVVQEALEMVQGRLQERGIRVEVTAELPPVYGDRLRLIEVMQNLVENGVRFMGDQQDPWIRIGTCRREGEQVLFVQDNGIGIEPQYHQKIFGLFEQLDRRQGGTGIGLALVKRIIEVHGGRIWVESAGRNQGSCFCFTLPHPVSDQDVIDEQ